MAPGLFARCDAAGRRGNLLPASDSESAARVAAGVGYVCAHLDELRGTLGDDGTDSATPLGRLLAALRVTSEPADRENVPSLLDAVDKAVRRAGDVLGAYGPADRYGGDAVGVASVEIVYRCPLRQCLGQSAADVTSFPPLCQVSGRELARERLS